MRRFSSFYDLCASRKRLRLAATWRALGNYVIII